MAYKLENLFAYRFFEKSEGPLDTIRKYSIQEVNKLGKQAGITNIHEIYDNRVIIENWLYRQFIKQGGKPKTDFPYYATVYDNLPEDIQLHVRFQEPQCIRIPMNAFSKDSVSFTYAQSPRALTRKDNHPTRRKVLMWDEAEWAINAFPYDNREGTWLEMQIWEESVIQKFYNAGKSLCVTDCTVPDRLTDCAKEMILDKYSLYLSKVPSELFVDASSVYGTTHAIRVLILVDKLSEEQKLDPLSKNVLHYGALYHDIAREKDLNDNLHGYKSFEKLQNTNFAFGKIAKENFEILKFVIENHSLTDSQAKDNIRNYKLINKDLAINLLNILKDADALDHCRFGHIDLDSLHFESSRKYVSFAYQLLTIFREKIL